MFLTRNLFSGPSLLWPLLLWAASSLSYFFFELLLPLSYFVVSCVFSELHFLGTQRATQESTELRKWVYWETQKCRNVMKCRYWAVQCDIEVRPWDLQQLWTEGEQKRTTADIKSGDFHLRRGEWFLHTVDLFLSGTFGVWISPWWHWCSLWHWILPQASTSPSSWSGQAFVSWTSISWQSANESAIAWMDVLEGEEWLSLRHYVLKGKEGFGIQIRILCQARVILQHVIPCLFIVQGPLNVYESAGLKSAVGAHAIRLNMFLDYRWTKYHIHYRTFLFF